MLRTLIAITLVSSAILTLSPPAEACINGVRAKTDSSVRAISKAERLDRNGNYAAAIRTVKMTNLKRQPTGLRIRAKTVLASATIHSKGRLNRDRPASQAKSAEARAANLAWAVNQVKYFLKKRGDDPRLKVLLAEGLAQNPAQAATALTILEGLEKKGLIGSATGYATLAHLRREKGDKEGSAKALERCKQMSLDKSLCTESFKPKSKG
jgi:hypothetical protein